MRCRLKWLLFIIGIPLVLKLVTEIILPRGSGRSAWKMLHRDGLQRFLVKNELELYKSSVTQFMSEQDVEDCERVSNITGPRRISDAELGIAAAVFLERVFLNQTTARRGPITYLQFGSSLIASGAKIYAKKSFHIVPNYKKFLQYRKDHDMRCDVWNNRLLLICANGGVLDRSGQPLELENFNIYSVVEPLEYIDEQFDVIFVEGYFRLLAALQVWEKLKPDGILVLSGFGKINSKQGFQFSDVLRFYTRRDIPKKLKAYNVTTEDVWVLERKSTISDSELEKYKKFYTQNKPYKVK